MSEALELRPCPFCGVARNLMVEHMPGTILRPAYRVLCDNCGASTGYTDRGDHIAAWNARAEADAIRALKDRNETEPEREPDNRTDNLDNRLDGERGET